MPTKYLNSGFLEQVFYLPFFCQERTLHNVSLIGFVFVTHASHVKMRLRLYHNKIAPNVFRLRACNALDFHILQGNLYGIWNKCDSKWRPVGAAGRRAAGGWAAGAAADGMGWGRPAQGRRRGGLVGPDPHGPRYVIRPAPAPIRPRPGPPQPGAGGSTATQTHKTLFIGAAKKRKPCTLFRHFQTKRAVFQLLFHARWLSLAYCAVFMFMPTD